MKKATNTFLFTGEEPYLLQRDLQKWTHGFKEKYGASNFFSFPSHELDAEGIKQALLQWYGMFSEKSMIVLYGIPKDTTPHNKVAAATSEQVEKYLMDNIHTISKDTILILVSYKPDKRTKARKFFEKALELKQYPATKEKDALDFAAMYMSKHRWGSIDIPHLVHKTWTQLYRLINECDKLIAYAQYHELTTITTTQIDTITIPKDEDIVFSVLDTLFSDTAKTYATLEQLHQQYEDPFKMLGLLQRWTRLILWMTELSIHGIMNAKEMAAALNMHPFSIAKHMKHIGRCTQYYTGIKHRYRDLLMIEVGVKQGKLSEDLIWWSIKAAISAAPRSQQH
jgi:DNA polymerase III delta subunit